MTEKSYRESHLQKGAEYHSSFASRPHLAITWKLERKLLTRIVREYFPDGVPTHLDFACGTGRILGFLSPNTGSSTGVDLSASMLQVAHETLADVEIIEADLTRYDRLGCREFDLITAFRFFPNAEPSLRWREYALSVLPLGDRHMLRPIGLTEVVESLLTRSGLFAPLAQNLIYMCRWVDAEL